MTQDIVSSPRVTFNVYQTAVAALQAGISCIPIRADGTKSPAVKWKAYQKELPGRADVQRWFDGTDYGIAFITGAVSGHLEMLDFDSHDIYEQFAQRMLQEGLNALLEHIEEGYKERSPRGMHLYYRSPGFLTSNTKLAQRPLQQPASVLSLIETRGEAGYSIGAPSSGQVHPSGQPYQVLRGSLALIRTIAPEDRAVLHAVARTFDTMPAPTQSERAVIRSYQNVPHAHEKRRPGTLFNERATWHDILEPHGWTWVKRIGEEDFWRRPGKNTGISATTNYENSDYLYVFSTSTPFASRVGIDKFGAYTTLNHHTFAEATRALIAQGYSEDDIHTPLPSIIPERGQKH